METEENRLGRLNGLFSVMQEDLCERRAHSEFQQYAVTRQLERAKKRAKLGGRGLSEAAVTKFKDVCDTVQRMQVVMDPFIEHNARLFIAKAFERFNGRDDPEDVQKPYDDDAPFRNWRFGPGASIGTRSKHPAEKIGEPMSCTASAVPFVKQLRESNHYLRAYDIGNGNCGYNVVEGSRLATVPKNEETERTIAIEPSGNMALQLSLGEYISQVLKSIGLDISSQQQKNKLLAQRGSIDGSFSTIDMSSASDMFKIELVRRLLPSRLYVTMMNIRSRYTELPDGTRLELPMMSTMGNGFTFPMMTLIFTALVYACRLSQGGPSNYLDWSKTAVYGDDIIVPTHEGERLVEVLTGCGFVVNRDKSYFSGPFRESCGGDYYEGGDVTPFYVKDMSCDAEVYVAINKCFEWCAKTNIILWRTLGYLKDLLSGPVCFVPEWHGDDAGFRVAQVERRYKHLQVKASPRRTIHQFFEVMLACGGYTSPLDPNGSSYTPQPYKTRYVVRKSRLPRGYLDGRCPISRHDLTSTYITSYAFLFR